MGGPWGNPGFPEKNWGGTLKTRKTSCRQKGGGWGSGSFKSRHDTKHL